MTNQVHTTENAEQKKNRQANMSPEQRIADDKSNAE